jgi:hypothetical protein
MGQRMLVADNKGRKEWPIYLQALSYIIYIMRKGGNYLAVA